PVSATSRGGGPEDTRRRNRTSQQERSWGESATASRLAPSLGTSAKVNHRIPSLLDCGWGPNGEAENEADCHALPPTLNESLRFEGRHASRSRFRGHADRGRRGEAEGQLCPSRMCGA